jgi:hypothetical protein
MNIAHYKEENLKRTGNGLFVSYKGELFDEERTSRKGKRNG